MRAGLPSLQSHFEDLKELKLEAVSHLFTSILKTRNICTCKLTPELETLTLIIILKVSQWQKANGLYF